MFVGGLDVAIYDSLQVASRSDRAPPYGLFDQPASPQRRPHITAQSGSQKTPEPHSAAASDILSSSSLASPLCDMMSRWTSAAPRWDGAERNGSFPTTVPVAAAATSASPQLPTIHSDIGLFVGVSCVVLYDCFGSHIASFPFRSMCVCDVQEALPAKDLASATSVVRCAELRIAREKWSVKDTASRCSGANVEIPDDSQVDTLAVIRGSGAEGVQTLHQATRKLTLARAAFTTRVATSLLTCSPLASQCLRSASPARAESSIGGGVVGLYKPEVERILLSSHQHDSPAVADRAGRSQAWAFAVDTEDAMLLRRQTQRLCATATTLAKVPQHSSYKAQYAGNASGYASRGVDVDVTVIGASEAVAAPHDDGVATAWVLMKAKYDRQNRESAEAGISDDLGKEMPDDSSSVATPSVARRSTSCIRDRWQSSEGLNVTAHCDRVETSRAPAAVVTPAPAHQYPITCVTCGNVFDIRHRKQHLAECSAR